MMNQKHRRALGEVIVNQLGPANTANPIDVEPDIHPIKLKDGVKPTVDLIKAELDIKPDIYSVKRELCVLNAQAQAPRKGAMKRGSGMETSKVLVTGPRTKDTDINNGGIKVEAAEEGGDEIKRVKPKKSVSFAPCTSFSTSRPGSRGLFMRSWLFTDLVAASVRMYVPQDPEISTTAFPRYPGTLLSPQAMPHERASIQHTRDTIPSPPSSSGSDDDEPLPSQASGRVAPQASIFGRNDLSEEGIDLLANLISRLGMNKDHLDTISMGEDVRNDGNDQASHKDDESDEEDSIDEGRYEEFLRNPRGGY